MSDEIRILHVDDEPGLADLTATHLEREDDRITVRTTTTPTAGLDVLETEPIDCVVSDYNMPGTDGIKFLKLVRAEHPGLPFILYTGKGSEEVASEAIQVGVTDYLQKGTGSEQYAVLANRIGNAVAQHRAEQRVDETVQWYSRLLEYSSDYVMVVDPAGTVSYISAAVERMLGRTPEDLSGTSAFEFVHPADMDRAMDAFGDVIADPSTEPTVEFRVQHANGSWLWLEVRGRSFLEDSLIEGILVNARDITERKRREQQLERFKQAVEHAATAIYITDTDGTIEYVNPAFERITGYTADQAVGQTPKLMQSNEMADDYYANLWETILAGTTWQAAIINRRQSGELYTADQTIAPITDDEGEPTAFVAIQTPLTNQRARDTGA